MLATDLPHISPVSYSPIYTFGPGMTLIAHVDSAEAVDGAPVAIQVAARTLFDEELLEAADTISKVLSG